MECVSSSVLFESACRLSMSMGRSFPLPINAQQIRAIIGCGKKEFVHLVARRDKSTKSETRHSRISQLKIPSQATASISPGWKRNGGVRDPTATINEANFFVFRSNIAAAQRLHDNQISDGLCLPQILSAGNWCYWSRLFMNELFVFIF